jgi:hypothetical protein
VLGIGLAGLIIDMIASDPALAFKKVSLFKVVSLRDEVVIGMTPIADPKSYRSGARAGIEGTLRWNYAEKRRSSPAPTGKRV